MRSLTGFANHSAPRVLVDAESLKWDVLFSALKGLQTAKDAGYSQIRREGKREDDLREFEGWRPMVSHSYSHRGHTWDIFICMGTHA